MHTFSPFSSCGCLSFVIDYSDYLKLHCIVDISNLFVNYGFLCLHILLEGQFWYLLIFLLWKYLCCFTCLCMLYEKSCKNKLSNCMCLIFRHYLVLVHQFKIELIYCRTLPWMLLWIPNFYSRLVYLLPFLWFWVSSWNLVFLRYRFSTTSITATTWY